MALVGIDLGSSTLKATLLDEQRGLFLTRSLPYSQDWIGDQPGLLERDAEVYWDAVVQALASLMADSRLSGRGAEGVFSIAGAARRPHPGRHRHGSVRHGLQGVPRAADEVAKICRP
jgi:sugar (pentulose or hexulose) kinase